MVNFCRESIHMNYFLTTAAIATIWACVLTGQAMAAEEMISATTRLASTRPVDTQPADAQSDDDEMLPRAYEFFVSELEMSARQVVQLRRVIRETAEKLDAWDKENASKVKAWQQELVEAYRAGDRKSVASLQDLLAKLQKERSDLLADHEKAFVAMLSPKQKRQYAVLQVTADALDTYRELNLNDRQTDVIKTLAGKVYDQIEKANNDKAVIDAAYEQLFKEIESRVLTADQLQALKNTPATKPAPAKK